MKFSERWLREWVDPPIDTRTLVEQLTTAGLEVDGVAPVAGEFTDVRVGLVQSVEPHPDADKLRVCRVDVAAGEPLKIVCGAANVYAGMRAPVAVVGAELPGGMQIKRAKLRGVESFGMLCSAKELGLAETAEGLLDLPGDAPVGQPLRAYLGLEDTSIEVDLTPNRGDCLGIEGIAREVAVLNRMQARGPEITDVAAAIDAALPVRVDHAAGCPRYLGRVIRGIDPSRETPLWMRERLRRSGLRSIAPTVDVTNYVLLELGQPMHAFDRDRLAGGIVVRMGDGRQPLRLLDGSEVTPDDATLVIADDRGPVALAGIMGGEATAVVDDTHNLFLECAFFTPEVIAGRARRYGLHTDSSHRFERGVDFELQWRALQRATTLLQEIVGGEPGPVTECTAAANLPRRAPIRLRRARIQGLLGLAIDDAQVVDVLGRLGMAVSAVDGGWQVTPPGFRFDIAIEVDLIEELMRIVGYDRIPDSAPMAHLDIRPAPESELGTAAFRGLLVARGYQEAITYSFVEPALQRRFDPQTRGPELANPISADMAIMRTTLWPGLVQVLRHNLNRQASRVRLFETGQRFEERAGEIYQETVLAGVVAGSRVPEQWGIEAAAVDFYDVKADIEALIALSADTRSFRFEATEHPALHPGQAARVSRAGEPVGLLGAMHPGLLAELDLDGPIYLFELRQSLLDGRRLPQFESLSRFPAIRRDIAIVVADGVDLLAIEECIGQAASHVLKKLQLFDVYRGEHIDSGKKSLALGLTLQDPSRTMTDEDVNTVINTVVESLARDLGAILRG